MDRTFGSSLLKMSHRGRLVTVLLAALWSWAAVSFSAAQSSPPPKDRENGWVFLFDGLSAEGWRIFGGTEFPLETWRIEDGWIKREPPPRKPFLKRWFGAFLRFFTGPRRRDLVTESLYSDFDLTFEWRISKGGNSGVKYFIIEQRGEPIGHEYQILDDLAGFQRQLPEKNLTASFYDVLPPAAKPLRPAGEVNRSRIIVCGATVQHWLNGVKVLEYALGSPQLRRAIRDSKFKDVEGFGEKVEGRILLQDHGDEVWFRNLRIRRLEDCGEKETSESDSRRIQTIGTAPLQKDPQNDRPTHPRTDQTSRRASRQGGASGHSQRHPMRNSGWTPASHPPSTGNAAPGDPLGVVRCRGSELSAANRLIFRVRRLASCLGNPRESKPLRIASGKESPCIAISPESE